MTFKDDFYRELEKNKTVLDVESEGVLWHDTAAQLSRKNASRYNKCILIIAFSGVMFASCFFLYFSVLEADNVILISMLALLLFIVSVYCVANFLKFHKKYLEFRVLAETFRVQYYISRAGVDKKISQRLPLMIENDLGWIKEVLENFPNEHCQKESIKDYWINSQRNYHLNALKKASRKKKLNDFTSDAILVLTVISYLTILILELIVLNHFTVDNILIFTSQDLKFYLGILSVIALLYKSIYGKMSLTEMISNYERMVNLYDNVLKEIGQKGESEGLVLRLADECLAENSLWYAFQKQNKVELVI